MNAAADKSGRFGTMDDAATNWAINNRHLSYERERGALIYYNTPTKKYELGETFIGNENTVIGGFIVHYLNILYNPSSMLVGFVHSHPYPWIEKPNGERITGHNDFPSYPQDGSFVSRYIHDIFVLGLIDIQEVYVVPYKVCPGCYQEGHGNGEKIKLRTLCQYWQRDKGIIFAEDACIPYEYTGPILPKKVENPGRLLRGMRKNFRIKRIFLSVWPHRFSR